MGRVSFNLVDEPWIPCLTKSGEPRKMGLYGLLANAHEIRSLDMQSPLSEAALLRLLLATLHRIVSGPRSVSEWAELYRSGKLPTQKIDDYFSKWRDRFDLFSEAHPFYQTSGLAVLDKSGHPSPAPVTSIMVERSNGHNKTVFDHSIDAAPVCLSPAESALALITFQMYSLGGLNRKTTNLFGYQLSFYHAVLVNGILVAMQGENLFETFVLNLLVCNENEPVPLTEEDSPVWERDDMGATGPSVPRGYLDYLTCKCRHILLMAEKCSKGVGVRFVHVAQGEAFPDVDNPATIKRQKRDGSWFPLQLDPDRLLWRDSSCLFSFDKEMDRRPKIFRLLGDIALKKVVPLPSRYRCNAYGLANDKANPLAWRKEGLNIPRDLLSDQELVAYLKKGIEISEKAGAILGDSIKTFIADCLPDGCKEVNEKAKAIGALSIYWDRMERHFHLFLGGIEERDAALETWAGNAKRTARETFETCLRHHYADSARQYRAWTNANRVLNTRLATLDGKEDKG
jgi:CRISPR system Cascade subunit CasA